MKNFLLVLLAALAVAACQTPEAKKEPAPPAAEQTPPPDMHNAANALDVIGTYTGTLPCADCEGIETEIQLLDGNAYDIKMTYKGKSDKPVEHAGAYSWNDAGNTITLDGQEAPNKYFVGENVLFKLDMEGKRIEGNLADKYVLRKQ